MRVEVCDIHFLEEIFFFSVLCRAVAEIHQIIDAISASPHKNQIAVAQTAVFSWQDAYQNIGRFLGKHLRHFDVYRICEAALRNETQWVLLADTGVPGSRALHLPLEAVSFSPIA